MRNSLPIFAICIALFSTLKTKAQNDRFAYAVTDATKDGCSCNWSSLRKIDLQTGTFSDVMLNGSSDAAPVFTAGSKKQITKTPDKNYGNLLQTPFGTGVAAIAYDAMHNRLYYTPMFVDQLRYIDLATMKVYFSEGQPFTGAGNMQNNEGKIITRMTISPDGEGYAISNDGNSFVRFSTTGKSPKVEQLGALVDDASNGGVSIHEKATSFGGDMIADDNGSLYIISGFNHIFKINIETKTAIHLGAIQGLPAGYTSNGAVITAEGSLLISSAVDAKNYFIVDTKTWTAAPYTTPNGIFRSSDLANSNFLQTSKTSSQKEIALLSSSEDKDNHLVSVYPNPVIGSSIKLQINNLPKGTYSVALKNATGSHVLDQKLTITANGTHTLQLSGKDAKGVYLLQVTDNNNKAVAVQKVILQ